MNLRPLQIDGSGLRRLALSLSIALILAGCAATQPARKVSNIEIQEEVGFTITEQVRVATDVRGDYDRALALLQQGRDEEGIELLEAVAKAAPGLSAPRIDLGTAYHRIGNLEAAEENLRKAIELNPEHPLAHNELGIVYRKTGRFAEARSSYEAALAIYPGFHYARRNLAVLCDLYLADLNCALENYEAYMDTVPDDQEASMWIADLRNRLGK